MEELESLTDGENSSSVRERVATARTAQAKRFTGVMGVATNAGVTVRDLRALGAFSEGALAALRAAAGRMALSARAYHRALRVARTVADLDGESRVGRHHAIEALAYRSEPGAEADGGGP